MQCPLWDLNCKPTLYKLSERKSPLKQLAEDGYETTTVPTTLGNNYTHYNTMVSVKIYNSCDLTFTLFFIGFFSSKCSIFPYKMKIKLWMTTIFLIFWQIYLLGKMVLE